MTEVYVYRAILRSRADNLGVEPSQMNEILK